MTTKKRWGILAAASLLTAILAHGFMLTEWMQNRYITGPNDGLSQMLPFKHFLYESMRNGDFFYSERFGLGGGTFSQLGYYFSTSIVFLATAAVTALLEFTGIIETPDLIYWADVTVFVSIVRLTGILLAVTGFFRLLGIRTRFAYLGAMLYGVSIWYFRHVTYWEFFADAMLLLPLLLIGAERIMRYGKPGWFIAAVALSMTDNFYFAYINFLLAFIYIVFRWFIPLLESEMLKKKQVVQFIIGGLLGAAISAPFFVPSVYGFLNNFRPPFEGEIPLFKMTENILSNGTKVVLPAIAVFGLFLFPLYKQKLFRLFALLTVVLAALHASPLAGSVFNGFSAPQYRWEHMLMLTAGGVAAVVLQSWKIIRAKHAVTAALSTVVLYMLFDGLDLKGDPSLYADSLVVMALAICLIALLATVRYLKHWDWALYAGIALSALITVNLFQEEKLAQENDEVDQVQGQGIPQSFLESDRYNGDASRELIEELTEKEEDPLARFDWMIDTRNNTPIVQDFLGMSIYSSILNRHLLKFYLEDLAIDMGRESVSRYAGLGGRTNLYSLLNGVYTIRSGKGEPIPYDFKKAADKDGFTAYENSHRLPLVRTADRIYTEEELSESPVLARERAMLDGAVLEKWEGKSSSAPAADNLIDDFAVEPVRAHYEDGVLKVTEKDGGLDLKVSNTDLLEEDLYISFYVKRAESDKGFRLRVNEYETTRKPNDSIYRTRVNDMTVRIPSEEVVRIRLPEGVYAFHDIEVYAEDYQLLKQAEQQSADLPEPNVKWEGGHAEIQLNNSTNAQLTVIPIPYEKGWTAKVNDKKTDVLKANYAFTAVEIEPGQNSIQLSYRPPYFVLTLLLCLAGLGGTLGWLLWKNKSKPRAL